MNKIHALIDENRERYIQDLIDIVSAPSIGTQPETVRSCAKVLVDKMASMGIDAIQNAKQFVTVAFVMTFGIAASLIIAPITCKKITSGMLKVKNKDNKWMDMLMTAMFVGMLAAFLGYIVCNLGLVFEEDGALAFHYQLEYWMPVFVMAISAGLMAICGILLKKFNWKWLNDYALPISMIGSMALSIPLSLLING